MCNIAKQCTACGRTLTLDNFRVVPLSPDGHAHICKECGKKRREEKKEDNMIKGGGNPKLADITPRELIEELKYRGYTGTLTIVREIKL